jgi:hypothetical protein
MSNDMTLLTGKVIIQKEVLVEHSSHAPLKEQRPVESKNLQLEFARSSTLST